MKQLKDYKAINKLEMDILERSRNAIKNIESSAKIILYGSRARGDAEPESDYDLLILTDGEVTIDREDVFRRQLFSIELETGAVLTVILMREKDWNSTLYNAMPLCQNIQREGIVL